jgi:hypothetical protein
MRMIQTISDGERYLRIDRNNLDKDVIQQPQLYWEVSRNLTEALDKKDQLKDLMERTFAKISNDIRGEEPKSTESKLKELTTIDPEYQTSRNDYLNAKAIADKWQALKDAFSQRSFMLKELVSLYSANYFSESTLEGGHRVKANMVKNRMSVKRRELIER